jgi:pyruvate dehydrogenase E2 component (dihydrolipoamide acetyltransferase)
LQTGEEMPIERASASGDPASPIPVPATLHNQPTSAAKPPSTKGNPTISPRARRIANELNISWHHIKGSGQTGRIIERDIRAVTAQPPDSTGHIRELIANRLWQSQNETAAVTLTTEADATGLVDLRAGFKASQGTDAPTYNHMIAKLTALALGEHPALNASWQNGAPHQYESVHLGLAVDTEGGLLVPVIRDADSKSLAQIATEARALALKARRHTLGPDALQGGTFTISNLGMYGIDAFTPIINLPQAAILGLGRIVEKPAVFQGQVVPRALMALSLTFDHRILDGGPAARFLDRVRTFIEQPDLWWKK